MSRKFVLLLAVAGLVILGACGSGSGSGSGGTTTIPAITIDSGASAAQCSAWASEYASLMSEYHDAIVGITYATPSLIATVKSTGRSAVQAGRALIAACPQYSGSSSLIDDLEDSLNEL